MWKRIRFAKGVDMKQEEKYKTQKVIEKIQSGFFDENDIDNLFMKLRAYSGGFSNFREIADFVAHNDSRDRGITNDSLKAWYYNIKYFLEYANQKKELNIDQNFPTWVILHMKNQIDKLEPDELFNSFKIKPDSLKLKIDKAFKHKKNDKVTKLKNDILSKNAKKAISYVMQMIIPREAFTQEELLHEVLCVMDKNDFTIDKNSFEMNSEKIMVCIILLLHKSKYEIDKNVTGRCEIASYEYSSSPNNEDARQGEKLVVCARVPFEHDGKKKYFAYHVLDTSLLTYDWCSENCFVLESRQNKEYQRFKSDANLVLNDKFILNCID